MSPYEILGVEPNATAKQIAAAYRKLARKHHPDTGGDAKVFAKIAEAYEIVGDETNRAKFDETGEIPNTENKIHAMGRQEIQKVWIDCVRNSENPAKSLRDGARGGIETTQNNIIEIQENLTQRRSQHQRFLDQNDEDDEAVEYLASLIAKDIEHLEGELRMQQTMLRVGKYVLDFIEGVTTDTRCGADYMQRLAWGGKVTTARLTMGE